MSRRSREWRDAHPATPDGRLDPYRDRVGRLTSEEGTLAGYVLVQVDALFAEHGRWWRRTWSPGREFAMVWVVMQPADPAAEWAFTDAWMVDEPGDETLTDELADWAASRFSLYGRTYTVEWLDDEQSAAVRRERFD